MQVNSIGGRAWVVTMSRDEADGDDRELVRRVKIALGCPTLCEAEVYHGTGELLLFLSGPPGETGPTFIAFDGLEPLLGAVSYLPVGTASVLLDSGRGYILNVDTGVKIPVSVWDFGARASESTASDARTLIPSGAVARLKKVFGV